MKRLTIPAIRRRKAEIAVGDAEPLVMLTAYTVRTAQLLDPHCDLLLVGDSFGAGDLWLGIDGAGNAGADGGARGRRWCAAATMRPW